MPHNASHKDPYQTLIDKGLINKPTIKPIATQLSTFGKGVQTSGKYTSFLDKSTYNDQISFESGVRQQLINYNAKLKDETQLHLNKGSIEGVTDRGSFSEAAFKSKIAAGENPVGNAFVASLTPGSTKYGGIVGESKAQQFSQVKPIYPSKSLLGGAGLNVKYGDKIGHSTYSTSGLSSKTKDVSDYLLAHTVNNPLSPIDSSKYHRFETDIDQGTISTPVGAGGAFGDKMSYKPKGKTFVTQKMAPELKDLDAKVSDVYSTLNRKSVIIPMSANRKNLESDKPLIQRLLSGSQYKGFKRGVIKQKGVDLDASGKIGDKMLVDGKWVDSPEAKAIAFKGEKHMYSTRRGARTEMKLNKEIGAIGGTGSNIWKNDSSIVNYISEHKDEKGKSGRIARRLDKGLLKTSDVKYSKDNKEVTAKEYSIAAKSNIKKFGTQQNLYVTSRLNVGIPISGSDYSKALGKNWSTIAGNTKLKDLSTSIISSNQAKYKKLYP